MATGRSRKSRGLTAGAAFVFAVLLTGAAAALQSTVPITVLTSSQGALVAQPVCQTFNGQIFCDNGDGTQPVSDQSTKTVTTKLPPKAGMDVIAILDTKGSTKTAREVYFPVCPSNPPISQDVQNTRYSQASTINASSNIQSKTNEKRFGDPTYQGRCIPSSTNPSVLVSKTNDNAKWPQWTAYCELKTPGITTGANSPSGGSAAASAANLDDQTIMEFLRDIGDSGYKCQMFAPGELDNAPAPDGSVMPGANSNDVVDQVMNAKTDAERNAILAKIPADQRPALADAFADEQAGMASDIVERKERETSVQQQINAIRQGNSDACPSGFAAAVGALAVGDCAKLQALQKEQADLALLKTQQEAQYNNLASAAKSLDPNANLPGRETPPYNYGGGMYTRPIANPTGSQFGNPTLGAGSAVASPFGGACTTGYVCSGNTLYYQSAAASPYSVGSVQCMTQPYQACQYGCQQPYGMTQPGATGQSSTLGTAMAGLQVFSALSSLFGGGSSNSALATNPNLSRSCAISPQQQSPFGTGTSGQSCPQPPPQPNPAQCTSGTWKPTSSGGCLTGYQCVPGVGGSGSGPTAQLSCQPQMADTGMPISFSFSCGNSNGSTGTGFSTGGQISGNTSITAPVPPSGQNSATFTLTCIKEGVTASKQCKVDLARPGIVLVTNPKQVQGGEIALIGWITSGMQSCVVSSPDQPDFTQRNAGITSTNGAATTSPITATARFQLDCQSLGGGSRQATTTVVIN